LEQTEDCWHREWKIDQHKVTTSDPKKNHKRPIVNHFARSYKWNWMTPSTSVSLKVDLFDLQLA